VYRRVQRVPVDDEAVLDPTGPAPDDAFEEIHLARLTVSSGNDI